LILGCLGLLLSVTACDVTRNSGSGGSIFSSSLSTYVPSPGNISDLMYVAVGQTAFSERTICGTVRARYQNRVVIHDGECGALLNFSSLYKGTIPEVGAVVQAVGGRDRTNFYLAFAVLDPKITLLSDRTFAEPAPQEFTYEVFSTIYADRTGFNPYYVQPYHFRARCLAQTLGISTFDLFPERQARGYRFDSLKPTAMKDAYYDVVSYGYDLGVFTTSKDPNFQLYGVESQCQDVSSPAKSILLNVGTGVFNDQSTSYGFSTTTLPYEANQNITAESSDPNVVEIDSYDPRAIITHNEGTCTLTVWDYNHEVSASAELRVEHKATYKTEASWEFGDFGDYKTAPTAAEVQALLYRYDGLTTHPYTVSTATSCLLGKISSTPEHYGPGLYAGGELVLDFGAVAIKRLELFGFVYGTKGSGSYSRVIVNDSPNGDVLETLNDSGGTHLILDFSASTTMTISAQYRGVLFTKLIAYSYA
jgi:hypothetical protein